MTKMKTPGHTLRAIRDEAPLVHNVTNFVAMDIAANLLLAVGASPVMTHAIEEVADMAAMAGGLAVNMGTFTSSQLNAGIRATAAARAAGTPWVLDPVGVGATKFRNENAGKLLDHFPTVIRGNGSEILALAGVADSGAKGVDSGVGAEAAAESASSLACSLGCVVAVTGEVDFITDGTSTYRVAGGHALLPKITATGCSLTALVGAALAVEEDPLTATVNALSIMAVAGKRAGALAKGPGSMRVELLDALHALTPEQLDEEAEIQ